MYTKCIGCGQHTECDVFTNGPICKVCQGRFSSFAPEEENIVNHLIYNDKTTKQD